MTMAYDIKYVIQLLDEIDSIYEARIPIEMKHSLIFKQKKTIDNALGHLNLVLEWHDPDLGYEEEIESVVNAMHDMKRCLSEVRRELERESDSMRF